MNKTKSKLGDAEDNIRYLWSMLSHVNDIMENMVEDGHDKHLEIDVKSFLEVSKKLKDEAYDLWKKENE